MEFLVSSAAIRSTSFKVLSTLNVISSRFPIGVAHKYRVPVIIPPALLPFHLLLLVQMTAALGPLHILSIQLPQLLLI